MAASDRLRGRLRLGAEGLPASGGWRVTIEAWRGEISRRSERGSRCRFGRRRALGLALAVLPLGSVALGQGAGGSGFRVSGVAAEAAAETAAAARERAIAQGLRTAWAMLLAREAPADAARLSAVTQEELDRLVESFEVEGERVGATRYAATLAVNFRPEAVRALLARSPSAAPAGRVEVVAPLSGIADWVELRRRLGNAPAVGGVEVLALSRSEARLALMLPGGAAGAAGLGQAGLSLSEGPAGLTLRLAPGP
jgi:hypothetical protein